jgi:hypothetical protein
MWLLLAGCGSRTPTSAVKGPPDCSRDEDCDGADDRCYPVQCVDGWCEDRPPVSCDDQDPCTSDVCDPATGTCLHPPATVDLDLDGHRAPLPGQLPSDPGACGDDCDDRNAAAFPGGTEVCDGADNDCNGVVDDGASLAPSGDAVLVSIDAAVAEPAALSFANGGYVGAFNAEVAQKNSILLAPLTPTGQRAGPLSQVTTVPADTTGGAVIWIGDRFGVTWSDRREARGGILNWEVYFNLLNPDRTKRTADIRITNAEGFSLNSSVVWTGLEFVVVWQDDGMNVFELDEIYGQRIDRDGGLVGGNDKMGGQGPELHTAPAIAAGRRSLGLAWVDSDALDGTHHVLFAPYDFELKRTAPSAVLSGVMPSAVYPVIAYSASNYFVVWYEEPTNNVIYGAVRDEQGQEVIRAKPITQGTRHARSPALLPYGDRMLLVWADDRDGNGGYELYAKMLDRRLDALSGEQRLTTARGDSLDPFLSFGPGGDVGVLFNDNRPGVPQAFFTRLRCVLPVRDSGGP